MVDKNKDECEHKRLKYLYTESLYQRNVVKCLDCGMVLIEKEGYRE